MPDLPDRLLGPWGRQSFACCNDFSISLFFFFPSLCFVFSLPTTDRPRVHPFSSPTPSAKWRSRRTWRRKWTRTQQVAHSLCGTGFGWLFLSPLSYRFVCHSPKSGKWHSSKSYKKEVLEASQRTISVGSSIANRTKTFHCFHEQSTSPVRKLHHWLTVLFEEELISSQKVNKNRVSG